MTPEEEKSAAEAWDVVKHADMIRTYRVSYALVAQAMFMVSYTILFASGKTSEIRVAILEVVICIFGLAFSLMQYLLAEVVSMRLRSIREKYDNVDTPPPFTLYRSVAIKYGSIQNMWIPLSLATVWAAMLLVTISAAM